MGLLQSVGHGFRLRVHFAGILQLANANLDTCMKSPTAFGQNRLSITGLDFTTLSALTQPLKSERWTSHTSTKRKYEKRHDINLMHRS